MFEVGASDNERLWVLAQNPKQKKGIQVVQFLGLCIPQFRNLTDGPTGGRAFFHDQPIGHTHTSSTVAQSWLTLEARSAGQDMGLDFH